MDVIIDFSGASFFFIIKEITDLFDKIVKYIMSIIFRTNNSKDSQESHPSLGTSRDMNEI